MTPDEVRAYLLAKPGAWEDMPFGPEAVVYKVKSKMFALTPADAQALREQPFYVVLKCDPTWAMLLRDTYPAITGAWHFNKRHWNSVDLDGTVPDDEVREMIDRSYALVVKNLPKRERAKLGG
jgi:predicted DNA-binding protein (MmcQ/YjbR family)